MHVPLYPSFLHLGSLTNLSTPRNGLDLHLDTLLGFLEENRSLERATLDIRFKQPSLRSSLRRAPIGNRFRSLSTHCEDTMDFKALISGTTLQKGASLVATLSDMVPGLGHVLSAICAARLSNLPSPTFMVYHIDERSAQLSQPNGSFAFKTTSHYGGIAELPLPPLTNIRVLHVRRWVPDPDPVVGPVAFPPSSFPVLEALAIEREAIVSYILSTLFSNPSFSPSLRTLAFLDCDLNYGFMDELARFASNRKNTTSTRLNRVIIIDSKGYLPKGDSVDAPRRDVRVVEIQFGEGLPTYLIGEDFAGEQVLL